MADEYYGESDYKSWSTKRQAAALRADLDAARATIAAQQARIEALTGALAEEDAIFKFAIGAEVLKWTGSYWLACIVKARFFTDSGDPRYVVDHKPIAPGLLNIYNEEQLCARSAIATKSVLHLRPSKRSTR
jgi:hypothetical protein